VESFTPIVPGLALIDGVLTVCPGCGLAAQGRDPFEPREVEAWCLALFDLLTLAGQEGWTKTEAIDLAQAYNKEAWHPHE